MSEYLRKSKAYKGYHYNVLKPEMLEYLHSKTKKMLEIIISILEENQIRYMICGGTLLGAVTTGKFIPWDEDVDICVLEDDYDRMKKCLLESVPEWMIVQCKETEPSYYHGWVKVRDRGSVVYPFEEKYSCNGVWIDLYKLIKVKKKKANYIIAKEHLVYLHRRKEVGALSGKEFFKRVIKNKLLSKMVGERLHCIMNSDSSDSYIVMSASKTIIDIAWCMPPRKYEFEGFELDSFYNADGYLQRHYGVDYMVLPPDEDRRVGIYRVEFD